MFDGGLERLGVENYDLIFSIRYYGMSKFTLLLLAYLADKAISVLFNKCYPLELNIADGLRRPFISYNLLDINDDYYWFIG